MNASETRPWAGRGGASLLILLLTLVVAGRTARADKAAADYYAEGDTAYNVGEFAKAIDAFKKAYELETDDSKKPTYHYNMAQSYRQLGDCAKAAFFYKRVLAAKAKDTKKPLSAERKAEIEERVAEVEKCAAEKSGPPPACDPKTDKTCPGYKAPSPDPGTMPTPPCDPTVDDGCTPDVPPPAKCDPDLDEDCKPGQAPPAVPATGPTLLVLHAGGGAAKIATGGVGVPVQPVFALTAGYPIHLGSTMVLDAGAGFTYTPVAYGLADGSSETAGLSALVANAGVTYEVAPKISLRGELGLGVLVFSGLVEGNPFILGGVRPTGALTMVHLRLGVSGEYAVTPAISVWASPLTFSYSPPKTGLRDDITSLTGLDVMAGIAYRM